MNINIAFNTIIYIMVFLFPGVLFRRSFFSGKFNNHFSSGNSLERLLWNILFSILSIISFCSIIYLYNLYSPLKFEFELKTDQILDSFICIYENKFPTAFTSVTHIVNSIKLLMSIYTYSIISGYFFNRIIFYLNLEKRFAILKFQNSWDYLTNSNKQNNSSHSIGDLYYTKVDIKSSNQELFTGKLHEILYDKDGKIEAITIQESYKFYKCKINEDKDKIQDIKQIVTEDDPYIIIHSETNTEFIYRKRIKGNLFTIFNNDIENISITYIKISDFYEKFQKSLKKIFSISFLIITIVSISYTIWDFHLIEFKNYARRLVFCVISPLVFGIAVLLLIAIFNIKLLNKEHKKYLNEIKDVFIILLLFLIPYLYTFNILKTKYILILLFGYFIVCGLFLSNKKENEKTDDNIVDKIEKSDITNGNDI